MDAVTVVAIAAGIGLAGTVLGAILGAVIAGIVAVRVTSASNKHAVQLAADERDYQDRVRKHTAGIEAATAALDHINGIRSVFDGFKEDGTPEQEWYEPAYRKTMLAVVNIDDEATAKTLNDIVEVYWAAWLATDLNEWTPHSLNRNLFKLAHATVHAYTQDQPLPNRSELDRMQGEIESNWQMREDAEAAWRAEEKAKRDAERAASGEPPKPVRRRRSPARPAVP